MSVSPEDRAAILDLAARYCHCFDFGDADGWASCFAEDGAFEAPNGEVLRGQEELRGMVESFEGAELPAPMRHQPSAFCIDGGSTSATMLSYFSAILLTTPPTTFAVGRFEDQLEKFDGSWKFTTRREILDWSLLEPGGDVESVLAALREALD